MEGRGDSEVEGEDGYTMWRRIRERKKRNGSERWRGVETEGG